MTLTSNNSVVLYEDETGYITADRRIIQKDNSIFSGREIARISDQQDPEAAVTYYKNAFEQLRNYVQKHLSLLKQAETSTREQALDRLYREVKQADALGDFDALFAEIQEAMGESGVTESGETPPDSGKTESSETPESASSGQSAGEEGQTADSTGESGVNESENGQEAETGKQESSAIAPQEAEEGETESPLAFYESLAETAESLSNQTNWQAVQHEFEVLKTKWQEGEEVPEEQQQAYEEKLGRLKSAEQAFQENKEEYFRQQKERREKNLQQREQLLEKMRQIVKDEKWNAFNEIKQIQKRWENVKNVPPEEGQKQQEEFDNLYSVFENNKVDYLVEKRQKEEDNLTGKLVILDKLEGVVNAAGPETENWKELDEQIDELARHWKKIGKVPKEQADQIWNRYRTLLDQYYQLKYEHNEEYRKELEKNVKEREKLIEEAESLNQEEDLAIASRRINQLHKRWKKIGPVPHEKNEELWQRFKKASDEFNQYKQDNLDNLKEQETKNLQLKTELCEKAEQIRDSEDWENGADQLNELMEQWKQIGPAPRRKAGKVWKRFKKTMDDYFEARRAHFREIRKQQKENYRKKKEIVEKITQLAEREDIQEALKEAKQLQEEFKSIGYVPIKKKDKIWKDYKEACDLVYGRAREEGGGQSAEGDGRRSGGDDSTRARKIHQEINKLRKECERLNGEIARYDESKTFIKPNQKGIKLREEIQQKIDAAQEKLDQKNQKIEELHRELEQVGES